VIKSVYIAMLLTAAMAVHADAALIVTVANTTMSVSDPTATVDVFIRADTDSHMLDNLGLEFVITPGSPRQIQFAVVQTFPGLTSDANYIFSAGGSPFGAISTNGFPNDTFIGGDATNPPAAVNVPLTDALLTRLQIVPAAGALAPIEGDVFTISLIPSANTVFFDADFNEIPFQSIAGTVTIGPAVSEIPEPSSLAIMLGMAGTLWVGKRFRRRAA
jgi:hypothetical protein